MKTEPQKYCILLINLNLIDYCLELNKNNETRFSIDFESESNCKPITQNPSKLKILVELKTKKKIDFARKMVFQNLSWTGVKIV